MGQARRVAAGGVVYHVLNRANRRARIFHKPRDYEAFLKLLGEGLERVPCRLLGLCLMPNHWHLVLWPHHDGDLSRLIAWITNPLRAKRAHKAAEWPWCSYTLREGLLGKLLGEWPVPRPADWGAYVEARWAEPELERIAVSLDRGRPFGENAWTAKTAQRLGLNLTLRPRGRPKAMPEVESCSV